MPPPEKPGPMRLPAHERPGNHTPGRPGERPDPRDQKPARRPGEPGLQGGPDGAGSTSDTGESRG